MSRIIQLNRNEIPYSPPKRVIEASKRVSDLNRYPRIEELDQLKSLISIYSGVEERHLFLGSGSDSLIMQVIHIFSRTGRVVAVDPTFSFATHVIKNLETKLLKIRISEPDFSLPLESFIDEIKDAQLMFIDNPNNPTGKILLDKKSVDEICKSIDGVLILDEAYYEFSHFSVVDRVEDYENLAIVRTMSKAFGLAGLRIGYIIAGEIVAKRLSKQVSPFALTTPSVYAAIETLADIDYMKANVRSIIQEREWVRREITKIGIKVYPSDTNFLLMHPEIPSISRRLKEFGIIVADLSDQMPSGFIRVSIGTREENEALLRSIQILCESGHD